MRQTWTIHNIIKYTLFRQTIKLLLDGLIGLLAWLIVFNINSNVLVSLSGLDIIAWFTIVVSCSFLFGITRLHYRMAGVDDLVNVLLAGVGIFFISSLVYFISGQNSIRHIYLLLFHASLFTGIFWVNFRVIIRAFYEGRFPLSSTLLTTHFFSTADSAVRTLIVGAGRAGSLTAEELKRHPELKSAVIGFVDDAFEKQGLRIKGIPVLGTTELLLTIIKEKAIGRVIIALPSAPGRVIRELSTVARAAGVELKTVPGIYNLLGNQAWRPEIKDISIDDLLKRDPIRLDQTALGRVLKNAVVLITGGGGSIGSELARQVAVYNPARIVLLGRGEHSLWLIERELRTLFPELTLGIELCDIRNAGRLRQVFHRWKPQIVFHAAAHKHVPFLEMHPEEAIENNVLGTKKVLEAALGVGTRVFVNISTDKSVNPTSVLGVSKCLAEELVRCGAAQAIPGGQYVSVRFGNVLGSRGSVIPIFMDQIRQGGPITITDPEMTRYFMTIPEASQLVLQAGLLGKTGGVYVLDMGEPVLILDLAKDLIILSGPEYQNKIDIQFTGSRPGEKLFEELFNSNENQHTQIHAKVFESIAESRDPSSFDEGLQALRRALSIEEESIRKTEILKHFIKLVPSYSPSPSGLGAYAKLGEPVDGGRVVIPAVNGLSHHPGLKEMGLLQVENQILRPNLSN